MRRTGISSIPDGIQRFLSMSTVTRNGAAHPDPPAKECRHVRISILKRSIRTAAAALVLVGPLSPAYANARLASVSVFPDLPTSTTADHTGANTAAARKSRSIELTSRLPWLALVGHRHRTRPTPSPEAVSALERQQQLDQELDRRIIICRGADASSAVIIPGWNNLQSNDPTT
jgi:hypothetical protein